MDEEIKRAKYHALKKYKELNKTANRCKAFGRRVSIAKLGWQHLIKISRRPTDLLYRLKLIQYIQVAIEQGELKETRKIKSRSTGELLTNHALEITISNRVIRVVIDEDKKGNLTFLSIIDKT